MTSAAAVAAATPLIEIVPASAWPRIAPIWEELVEECPGRSFFLRTPWIATWLDTFARRLEVSILVFHTIERPVGACLLVKSRRRRMTVQCRRISVNASGEPAAESTYIEHNNLICRAGWESAVALQLGEYLAAQGDFEIALDGFTPGPAYVALKAALSRLELEEIWHPAYYVDLRELRQNSRSFESVLGHATRKHLRQNIRRYSELGPVRLEPATDTKMALSMFDELAELNRRRWAGRTSCPVFSSQRFLEFHRALIGNHFTTHTVELLRLSAGARTVGVVYNFLDEGTAHFYQCGLDYSIDPQLSPGTVTLFHTIQHYMDGGLNIFDLLSGAASYKERLATHSRRLVWAAFRNPGLKTNVIQLARKARHRLLGR